MPGDPSFLRRDLLPEAGERVADVLPTARQITHTRYAANRRIRMQAPGQSPSEMAQLVSTLAHNPEKPAWTVWSIPDMHVISGERTIIPLTCDYFLQSIVNFAAKLLFRRASSCHRFYAGCIKGAFQMRMSGGVEHSSRRTSWN